VQLVEDWLRQDELPLIKVFSPKADFQLRTPDAKGANRPSHSVGDFQITQSLLDKGWDERWIGLALSQRGTPGQGKGGGGWPPSAAYLLESLCRAIYRKLYWLLRRLNEGAMEL